jgi:GDP-4-dehydro-6-deoxy-D-mannose reductase
MRVLITGATGFVGGHLAEALLTRGDQVSGLSLHAAWPAEWQHLAPHVPLRSADLAADAGFVEYLRDLSPDWVFHLAGYAHVGNSFREPDLAWRGNLDATRRLYDAVAEWGGRPRILHVSSGLIYGAATRGGLCDESCPLRPASPYASSKAAGDLVAYQYTQHPGLDIVRVRPFNHTGPRQAPLYAVPRFASQIASIETGRQAPVVETGDLSARRDLTDVRDMVRAYILLLEKGRRGEAYNAGTGTSFEMGDILAKLVAMARVPISVRSKGSSRPTDDAATADSSKLRNETGWRPDRSLDQTLADTLEYWRGEVVSALA